MAVYPSLEYQLARLAQLLSGGSGPLGSPDAAEVALSRINDAIEASGGGGGTGGVSAIAEVTVPTGGQASIDFASIPNTFKSLHLELTLRAVNNTIDMNVLVRANGDTGFNYNSYAGALYNGTSVLGIIDEPSGNSMTLARVSAAAAPANAFSAVDIRVHNYASPSLHKTFLSTFGYKIGTSNSNQAAGNATGTWRSMSAISSLSIIPFTGNFAEFSTAILWGIA